MAAQPTADAMLWACRDSQALPSEEALYTRYLWLSDQDVKLRHRTWSAAAGLLNGLSLSRRVVSPILLLLMPDDNGNERLVVKHWTQLKWDEWGYVILMRVNLRHYRMSPEQWDKLGDPNLEPLFHAFTLVDYSGYEGKYKVRALAPWLISPLGATKEEHEKVYLPAVLGLVKAIGYYQVPVVEARNFVWQTAIDFDRKAGYYSWLGVKDQATFDKITRREQGILALIDAVAESGVANEPRVVELNGRHGYWRTKDQVGQRGQGNRNPLEQTDPKRFLFDAQEVFGLLDNGFWATGLFDKDGVIQQSAPDGVGYNRHTRSNDGKIHVNLACLGCHDRRAGNGGLMPFSPFFRNTYAEPGPVAAGTVAHHVKQLATFEEQYLTPLDPWAKIDRQIYADAVFQANGLAPDQYAAALVETFQSWDEHLDRAAMAREHGVTEAAFELALQDSIVRNGFLDNTSAHQIVPKVRRQRIGRNQFAEVYARQELALRGLPVWSEYVKKNLRPWSK